MKYKSIFFISPPFYSHFNPLLTLALSFKKYGVKVYMGCSIEFKDQVLANGLEFYEIDISKNRNIQKAEMTNQPDSEKDRLDEFFESTKKGAVETLITQSLHRKADMLYNPAGLIEAIKTIDDKFEIDLYVVDILSYSVTLALYSLSLDFITFCPPHPFTIPDKDMQYGMPKYWPSAIKVNKKDLDRLALVTSNTQQQFTDVFNSVIEKYNPVKKIENAFALTSQIAIVYNYFDFNNVEKTSVNPKRIHAGNSFNKRKLDANWQKIVENDKQKILITLGTFLSNRKDVLKKLIEYSKSYYPDAQIIVSAGSNAKHLKNYESKTIIIEEFIPQIALMPFIDLVIFHGGCNTLTEAMYFGKKMLVLPFSSDQFNIAYDLEKHEIAPILNPNTFTYEEISQAFSVIEKIPQAKLDYYSQISQDRGTDFVAKTLLEITNK